MQHSCLERSHRSARFRLSRTLTGSRTMTKPTSPSNERPLDMIIFGGGGDLAARKLLPALYMAHTHCNLPADTSILAIGRKDWSREDYLKNFMEEQARPFIEGKVFDAQSW